MPYLPVTANYSSGFRAQKEDEPRESVLDCCFTEQLRRRAFFVLAEELGDLDHRVFLSAYQLAAAALEQDLSRVDAEALAGPFRVQHEARVDAGVT